VTRLQYNAYRAAATATTLVVLVEALGAGRKW